MMMTDSGRAVQQERDRIVEIHRAAVMETVRMTLGAGMPGGTPHERQKARWILKGFEMATNALRRAIDETLPAIALTDAQKGSDNAQPT